MARGKLKLFLGMVAGVGKTCAMLETAKGLLGEGHDVVIGYIETHGRKKTAALTAGFEIISRLRVPYQNTSVEEMDLDAILARRPELVLVDELAHTNVQGARHPKRFMDVEDLLNAGIDVFSTINVQHFESRLDIVRELSGVPIKESVPDSILDLADEIELIDLSPDELLSRLEKGEIYSEEKIQRSLQGFFKRGTLTALREISLRLAAEKVDREVVSAARLRELPQKLTNRDRLMVAIGPSPSATELLRWTRNKAFNLEAPWIAAYIDTGRYLSVDDRRLLDENIELARHLGAEVLMVSDPSVSRGLVEIAKTKHVTEIVLGRPRMSWVHRMLAPESPVDRLFREKQHFTIAIVTTDKIKKPKLWQLAKNRFLSRPAEYAISVANISVTSAVLFLVLPLIGYRGVGLVYLFSVLLQALITGRGPIYLSALLAAAGWNFLFIPPRFTFHIGQTEDVIHLVVFIAMASVLGSLTNKIRSREQASKEGERRATLLLKVARVFSANSTQTETLKLFAELLFENLEVQVSFYLKDEIRNEFVFRSEGRADLDSKEEGVAIWSKNNLRRAGSGTETLPQSTGLYFPLLSDLEIFGVIGFYASAGRRFNHAEKSDLETIAKQFATYLERQSFFQLKTKTRTLEESAKLQKALFSSISHELKTPLTSIMGGVQMLAESEGSLVAQPRQVLLGDILTSGNRLTHVVDQLLDMSRLESGRLVAKAEWVSLEEALGLVLGRLEARFLRHSIEVEGVAALPLIKADFSLTVDVLRNVLINALQYSNADSKIKVRAADTGDMAILEISDEGQGVSESFAAKMFERFSRERPHLPGGLGLGLSICQGFMESMHGTIKAGNRTDGRPGFQVKLYFKKAPHERNH